jgi:hypothetical protein
LKSAPKLSEITNQEDPIYFSGMFGFSEEENLFIKEIYLEDLTVIYISSRKYNFPTGYYKITDSKFDYKYIENLLGDFKKK